MVGAATPSPTTMARGPQDRVRSVRGLALHSPEIVYVLSGGAAKGLCQLGMIDVLEREGIRPDLIVGSSAGSIIGALYSYFGSVQGVRTRIEEVLASKAFHDFEKKYLGPGKPANGHSQRGLQGFFSGISDSLKNSVHIGMSFVTSAVIAEKDAAAIFGMIMEDITYEGLKIPFGAVAVDLSNGVSVTFTAEGGGPGENRSLGIGSGSDALLKAVMASAAIPLVFPAVHIDGRSFIDGGIMSNLPAREARALRAGHSILLVGFDVTAPVVKTEERLSSVELALRLIDLATRSTQAAERELVDVLFRPLDEDFPWSSFSEFQKYIEIGRLYMTPARIAAFHRAYREKCEASICTEKNVVKRLLARAKLRRIVL
jgi:NTE family protein